MSLPNTENKNHTFVCLLKRKIRGSVHLNFGDSLFFFFFPLLT